MTFFKLFVCGYEYFVQLELLLTLRYFVLWTFYIKTSKLCNTVSVTSVNTLCLLFLTV